MSTERTIDGEPNRAMAAFETRDFYLACFLRWAGYELVNLRDEGRRKVFVFRDRVTRRADVMGTLVNRTFTTAAAAGVAGLIIALNGYLLYTTFVR